MRCSTLLRAFCAILHFQISCKCIKIRSSMIKLRIRDVIVRVLYRIFHFHPTKLLLACAIVKNEKKMLHKLFGV